jgi:hypothetical protein
VFQLNFSQHGLEQLKVPASSDVHETEASYMFLARIAAPLQRLHEEILRLEPVDANVDTGTFSPSVDPA